MNITTICIIATSIVATFFVSASSSQFIYVLPLALATSAVDPNPCDFTDDPDCVDTDTPFEQLPPISGANPEVGSGPSSVSGSLIDACLDSGYSLEYCKQILNSDDPGNICPGLEAAGLVCPRIR